MKPITCIVFEDNRIAQFALKAMIGQMGHSCENLYDSADDILDIVNATKPDIIMMDISLNGTKSGIEAVIELRATNSNIPVLFLSAYNDPKTIKKIDSIDNSKLIPKPYSIYEIQQAILDFTN